MTWHANPSTRARATTVVRWAPPAPSALSCDPAAPASHKPPADGGYGSGSFSSRGPGRAGPTANSPAGTAQCHNMHTQISHTHKAKTKAKRCFPRCGKRLRMRSAGKTETHDVHEPQRVNTHAPMLNASTHTRAPPSADHSSLQNARSQLSKLRGRIASTSVDELPLLQALLKRLLSHEVGQEVRPAVLISSYQCTATPLACTALCTHNCHVLRCLTQPARS